MAFVGDLTILKCRFYYYSNMVKPADQMTAIEKMCVTHSSQEERPGQAMQGHMGSNGVPQEAEHQARMWARALLWFPWEGTGDAE